MRFNSKQARLIVAICAVAVFTGCGGFSASPSVSPATFLMPGFGLGKVHPDENQDDATKDVTQNEAAKTKPQEI